jgi:hypothetical protein
MCYECKCENVCSVKKILLKFDDEASKPLDVDITIDHCDNFLKIEKTAVD